MSMITYATELNSDNFKTTISNNELVVVDIWAKWCGPCKTISPIIDEVAAEFGEKVLVGKLETDPNKELVGELGVRNIPTILIYKNGEVVDRLVGMKNKTDITETINKYI